MGETKLDPKSRGGMPISPFPLVLHLTSSRCEGGILHGR